VSAEPIDPAGALAALDATDPALLERMANMLATDGYTTTPGRFRIIAAALRHVLAERDAKRERQAADETAREEARRIAIDRLTQTTPSKSQRAQDGDA